MPEKDARLVDSQDRLPTDIFYKWSSWIWQDLPDTGTG